MLPKSVMTLNFVLILFLLSSCSTVAAPTGKAGETESAPPSGNEANASPTPIPPTATSLPTFTPTPVSRVASPENIGEFVQVYNYWEQVSEQIGMPLTDGVIFDFVISQDGSRFAMGFCKGGTHSMTGYCLADSVIAVRDALTGEAIQTLPVGDLSVQSVSFSPDGKKLLATLKNMSLDFVMALYDLETGKRERAYFDGKAEDWSYVTAEFSPDGELILYNYKGEDDILEIRRASDWELLGSKLGVFSYENIVFGDDPNIAYGYGYDPAAFKFVVFRIDLTTYQVVEVARFDDENYLKPSYLNVISPNGKWIVFFWYGDSTLKVHDLESGELVATLSEPEMFDIRDARFSPDSRLLLADGAFVWDPDIFDWSPPALNAWDTSTWEHTAYVYGSHKDADWIWFDKSGESFITADRVEIMRFTLPDADFLDAQASVEKYLDAVSAGDYVTAADMLFLPENSAYELLVSNGFDPTDMPTALEGACAVQDGFPCLPLRDIVLGYREPAGEDGVVYRFFVTFTAPDGSQFIASDGTDEFLIWVGADGKIMSLHPGTLE